MTTSLCTSNGSSEWRLLKGVVLTQCIASPLTVFFPLLSRFVLCGVTTIRTLRV